MSVTKRKNGRYFVQVDASRGLQGERRRRTVGVYRTRKEADAAERVALLARDRGIDLFPAKITVGQLVDKYIANRETLGLGAKTLEEYRGKAALYIAPHLGASDVSKLKPIAISAWIATISKGGGVGGSALAPKTVVAAYMILAAALRWGVRLELVARNVCDAVEPPRSGRADTRAPTDDDVRKLLETARGKRWEWFITLALLLGARRGELLALGWDDVDLDVGIVTIRASVSQTAIGIFLKSTKSGRVRSIPLSSGARDALRAQRLRQNKDRVRAGSMWAMDSTKPIFTDELGRRLKPSSASVGFRDLARAAGVSITSLHACRHFAATHMIAAGQDIRTVSSVLGHSTANVTLAIYAHVIAGAERGAVDVLSERLDRLRG